MKGRVSLTSETNRGNTLNNLALPNELNLYHLFFKGSRGVSRLESVTKFVFKIGIPVATRTTAPSELDEAAQAEFRRRPQPQRLLASIERSYSNTPKYRIESRSQLLIICSG